MSLYEQEIGIAIDPVLLRNVSSGGWWRLTLPIALAGLHNLVDSLRPIRNMHQESSSKIVPDPISVDVSRARRVFEITWAGGLKTSLSLDDLRSMCDCALCRDEREKRETQAAAPRMLPVLGSSIRAEIASVNHVGRYALGVAWKDGHQSIYTFAWLFSQVLKS